MWITSYVLVSSDCDTYICLGCVGLTHVGKQSSSGHSHHTLTSHPISSSVSSLSPHPNFHSKQHPAHLQHRQSVTISDAPSSPSHSSLSSTATSTVTATATDSSKLLTPSSFSLPVNNPTPPQLVHQQYVNLFLEQLKLNPSTYRPQPRWLHTSTSSSPHPHDDSPIPHSKHSLSDFHFPFPSFPPQPLLTPWSLDHHPEHSEHSFASAIAALNRVQSGCGQLRGKGNVNGAEGSESHGGSVGSSVGSECFKSLAAAALADNIKSSRFTDQRTLHTRVFSHIKHQSASVDQREGGPQKRKNHQIPSFFTMLSNHGLLTEHVKLLTDFELTLQSELAVHLSFTRSLYKSDFYASVVEQRLGELTCIYVYIT